MAEKPWCLTSRMLKKSASFVLASFRPSTYSLAAALLDELFEHPAEPIPIVLDLRSLKFLRIHSVSRGAICNADGLFYLLAGNMHLLERGQRKHHREG